jgi:hypothetical protein
MSTPTDDALPTGPCLDEHGREVHPSHETLPDMWCGYCGVHKIGGNYVTNQGLKSLVEMLQKIEKESKT